VVETLTENPDLIAENSMNGRVLSALSAGWYWATANQNAAARNINGLADNLTWKNPAPSDDLAIFGLISKGVGQAASDDCWLNYKANVRLAVVGGNPFEEMRAAMASIGMSTAGAKGYGAEFGPTVKPTMTLIRSDCTHLLVAASDTSSASAGQSLSTSQESDTMLTSGSKLLSGIALGAAMSAASVATAQTTPVYAIGRCEVARSITVGTDAPGVTIAPTIAADSYMLDYQSDINSPLKKYATDEYSFYQAVTKIMIAPKHGQVILDPNTGPNISAAKDGWYYYVSDKRFSGEDTFAMQVEKYGLKIKVYYTIEVPASDESPNGLCSWDQAKMSQIQFENADGTALASTTFTPNAPFLPTSPSTYLANVTLNLPNADIGISNLAGAAVGQESTSGSTTSIAALDTNAGGYGWF
jgi:hypothetical protein